MGLRTRALLVLGGCTYKSIVFVSQRASKYYERQELSEIKSASSSEVVCVGGAGEQHEQPQQAPALGCDGETLPRVCGRFLCVEKVAQRLLLDNLTHRLMRINETQETVPPCPKRTHPRAGVSQGPAPSLVCSQISSPSCSQRKSFEVISNNNFVSSVR